MAISIAILGWGSLIWDPRELHRYIGPWLGGGPVLPIEFSRLSSGRRLTLVIDDENGVPVPTQYAVSLRLVLDEAIVDLARRERTRRPEGIGFVDQTGGTARSRIGPVAETIATWADKQGMNAVIWTDLGPNFSDETGTPFSCEAAAAHLRRLESDERA